MKRTSSGTTNMRGFKVFLGDVIQGRVFSPWKIGEHYDFEYRLEWLKANAEYTEFYHMCPLNGPEFAGETLDEAISYLDKIHEDAFALDEENSLPEGVTDLAYERAIACGDIPF